ncbi:Six-hairpin glycosidase-like protein [Ampelomyces quisqualis]|uniref:Six-hairpin glycosidase-like protein n=1 Tax=Ampelomyces quisqualis TaxID=50730 RepID=A0A6A5QLU5_AMPQU|nr:Six-hairpin glycosidase-like protein [Ampelomyces quisqualis]
MAPASAPNPLPSRKDTDFNYSKPWVFDLKTTGPNKTVDIGGNGVSLSMDAQGRVRTRMLQLIRQDQGGFGLDFGISAHLVSIKIVETNVALYHMKLANDIDMAITVKVAEDGSFVQYAEATNKGRACIFLPYTLGLNVSLNRASYSQLTEGGPIPLPACQNVLTKRGLTSLRVCNPYLDAQLVTRLDIDGQPRLLHDVQDQEVSNATLDISVNGKTCIPPGASARFCASFRLSPDTEQHTDVFPDAQLRSDIIQQDMKPRWRDDPLLTTYVIRRNVEYILANCVLPVSASTAVIRLLLETLANITSLIHASFQNCYEEKIRFAAQGHIEWVFTKAKRPHGFWHRSYLATGEPKDPSIFQLDQQCYPLLELCDYLQYFPEEIDFVRGIVATGIIEEILTMLASKQDATTLLWPTDETPGDDAVIYPHHFSSHVLMWRTFTRLHQLYVRLGSPSGCQALQLDTMAAKIKERTIKVFMAENHAYEQVLFAYLADGCGKVIFYHDGNDIPTAFAHEWGFVTTPKEVCAWRATMEFALSPANTKGYCNGSPYGGLGSMHSPGAWTLGYFQELAYAASSGNVFAMQTAWRKIAAAMQWDGTFPEAVCPKTAECTSKAWFSWPGAMIGALLIRMKFNGQEQVLLQTHN